MFKILPQYQNLQKLNPYTGISFQMFVHFKNHNYKNNDTLVKKIDINVTCKTGKLLPLNR